MGAIARHIARSYLKSAGKKHISTYPQIASFSFDLITDYIHLDGCYEVEELAFLRARIFPQLKNRRVCLDLGANIGNHALQFSQSFEKVLAFEPNPRTFRLLDINADLAENLTPYNLGLSDTKGEETAWFDPRNIAFSSLDPDLPVQTMGPLRETRFRLDRLDDIEAVQKAGPIDFVKVDVEGHEDACFAGALETFKTHKPLIVMEILAKRIEGDELPALDHLRACGYEYFYFLRANRPMARWPKPFPKLATTLQGLFLNKRPAKAFSLEPLDLSDRRDYAMAICSTYELNG